MEPNNADPYQRARFVSGIKTAAFVVILGAAAIMADHAFFIAPQKAPQAATAVEPAKAPSAGFAFADAQRPTEADVPPPPPTF